MENVLSVQEQDLWMLQPFVHQRLDVLLVDVEISAKLSAVVVLDVRLPGAEKLAVGL